MKVWIERLKRSKTMIFAAILSVIGVLQASTEFLSAVMTPALFGYFTLITGIIAAVLRVLTTEPLADK